MKNARQVSPLVAVLILVGCQPLTVRDIDTLPPSSALPETSEPGWVELRYFNDVSGNQFSEVESLSRYPDNPDAVLEITQLEVAESRGDNYASLVRGYIEPPVTGTYRFSVSGDDETIFLLSTDSSAASSVVIAKVPSYSSFRQFDKFSSQTSPWIALTAGKKYYFEVRHKEGVGGDHFSVAWEGSGISRSIVSSQYLHSPTIASQLYPTDEAVLTGFRRGYRVGFFDGSESLGFNDRYPPLDEDQDGLYDNWETQAGLNPSDNKDASSDADGDLLSAEEEYRLWSNPAIADTDGDGIPDGAEYAYGLDPLDASDAVRDLDGDGVSNLDEYEAGTSLVDPADKPAEPEARPEYVAGLMGQYFAGRNFDSFRYSTLDSGVTNDWGGGSPAGDISNNNFSIRWYSYVLPTHSSGSHKYRFVATRDDSVRIRIGSQQVVDSWAGPTDREYSGEVTLEAGTYYPALVEFSEGYGNANLTLSIIDTNTGNSVAPAGMFWVVPFEGAASPDTDSDGIPDVWEMRYGADPWSDDASVVYNNSGVTLAAAYETLVNPWTLEPAESWGGTTEPEEPVAPTEPETPPEVISSVTLSWTAPGTRSDGTSLALSEIDSYRLSYGKDAGSLSLSVSVPSGTTSHTFEALDPGTWYFSVQAVDTSGLISQPSEVVSFTMQ